MSKINTEVRSRIIEKALNRGNSSLREIAYENNIGVSTLNNWLRRHRASSNSSKFYKSDELPAKVGGNFSEEERFNHLLASKGLDDIELGKYCRQHGFYTHQLLEWKESFMSKDSNSSNTKALSEVRTLREEKKRLQKEIRRKDKALAEASALLILKKKAEMIWGDQEED